MLYTVGMLSILIAVSHLMFWRMFDWGPELGRMSPVNGGILQMLNVAAAYYLVFSAGITFYIARSDEFSKLGRIILVFFAGYYILRIVFGYLFFGFSTEELVRWIVLCAGAACYLVPLKLG